MDQPMLTVRWLVLALLTVLAGCALMPTVRSADPRDAVNATPTMEPEDVNALTEACAAHLETGELEEAVADCTAALEINPNLLDARNQRATAYRELGQLEAARADWERLLGYIEGCPTRRDHWYETRPELISFINTELDALVPSEAPTATPTAMPDAREAPAATPNGAFVTSRAALDVYEPGAEADTAVAALAQEASAWLSGGGDPAALRAELGALPKLSWSYGEPTVSTADLNGDGAPDVVIEPRFLGLAALGCLAKPGDGYEYICHPLPAPSAFGGYNLTMDSDVLTEDLLGSDQPQTVVTYTVQGGSGWTELLYVFRWSEPTTPDPIFQAALINWAGRSTWQFEADPTAPGRRQIVLSYPYLYTDGFDHKMVNHPLGCQTWRWHEDLARFALSDQQVDPTQSGWGPEAEITVEDRLRWRTNDAETAFRARRYEEALAASDDALVFAAAEDWRPADREPDWVGILRFRRSQTLAYLGESAAALEGMDAVASDYEGDMLGELAAVFLEGYGDGTGAHAAANGYAAMQPLRERLHYALEGIGALRYPLDADGLLCCRPGAATSEAPEDRADPAWPCVGGQAHGGCAGW